MTPDEIGNLTLSDLSAALARRALSSQEATGFALDRIAAFDGRDRLNAFITVTAEVARTAAAASDVRRSRGDTLGPLDGIPLALKDLFDTADAPTTAGSRVFRDRHPARDATVVRRLRDAGAVLLGKTNMLEFAFGYPHPDYGETVNPWNRLRTTGGSSGGSAAAVAAGFCWGAFGSDTGGSIRSPAAYCGVTGLKPTYGLVSCAGVVPLSWSLDHVGPIARTATDCAALLAAVGGHDPDDPAAAAAGRAGAMIAGVADLIARVSATGHEAHSLGSKRIGLVRRFFDMALSPGIARAAEDALAVLASQGAEIVEVAIDEEVVRLIAPTISRIYAVEAAAFHRTHLRDQAADFGPVMRARLEEAMRALAVDFVDAQRDRDRIRAAFRDLYGRVDLLAWPAQPLVAPPLGTTADAIEAHGGAVPTIEVEIAATGPANLTGDPSIAVPCGFVDHLPVALNIQGSPFSDAAVLRAAMAYQAATGTLDRPKLD